VTFISAHGHDHFSLYSQVSQSAWLILSIRCRARASTSTISWNLHAQRHSGISYSIYKERYAHKPHTNTNKFHILIINDRDFITMAARYVQLGDIKSAKHILNKLDRVVLHSDGSLSAGASVILTTICEVYSCASPVVTICEIPYHELPFIYIRVP
jgi:hypothetical protein